MIVFPGIYVANVYNYWFIFILRGRYFSETNILPKLTWKWYEILIFVFMIFIHIYKRNLVVTMSYLIGLNVLYWFSITYNHDSKNVPDTDDWGDSVILSETSNFHHWIWDYFLFHLIGGINFHIEHHLFPTINHVHIRKMSPIIKATCKEFNVNFTEYHELYEGIVLPFRN